MSLLTNLEAYWKLDESSGNAVDSSGNAHTLTNNNSVAFDAGKINNGADFGSSNVNASLSETASTCNVDGGAISLSCWVNVTTAPGSGSQATFFTQNSPTSNVTYELNYDNTTGTLKVWLNRLKNGVANGALQVTQTLTTGTWYHLVGTYDTTNSNLYLNGSLIGGPTAFSGNGSSGGTTGVSLGQSLVASRPLSGHVDEAGLWSRALSSSEVTSLYNGGAGIQYPFSSVNTGAFNSFF